ncbi:MAG: hypothetical protein J4451_01425 [DPANN group archaeon]|nr:hypothetical protein [DPANN group archaeon]
MKAYITWGVGYGPKILAQKNAQSDAHTEKIKFRRLESFERIYRKQKRSI